MSLIRSSALWIRLGIALLLVLLTTSPAAAPPSQAVAVMNSDERLMFVSGRDGHEVQQLVNDAATRGYRLIAFSWTFKGAGWAGPNCLLERKQTEEPEVREYRFLGGAHLKKLRREIDELSRTGFRVLPWTVDTRRFDNFFFRDGGAPFLIMERSTPWEPLEYAVANAISREAFVDKYGDLCGQGFEVTSLRALNGNVTMVMQRPVEADVERDVQRAKSCDVEIVDAMRIRGLERKLAEHSSRGYRLLVMTFSGFRGGSWGTMLFEPLEPGSENCQYVLANVGAEKGEDALTTMNRVGAEGFRLHPLTGAFFLAMEKTPRADTSSEYRHVRAETVEGLLDAIADAGDEGFRVVRLFGDSGVLLERQTRKARPQIVREPTEAGEQ